MHSQICLVLFGLTLFGVASQTVAEELSAPEVIERLKQNPFPAAYTADMHAQMIASGTPVEMNSALAYDRGSMKMKSTMNVSGQPAFTTVTVGPDGVQWIETRTPATNTTQVMKLGMKSITDEFSDLHGANLLGQGGMNFQPTPQMYDVWLESMDLTYEGEDAVSGEDCYVLSGAYKTEFIKALDPNGNLRASGALPDRTTLHLAKSTSFPLQITLTSAQGMNGTITLSNVRLDAEIEESEFLYSPPANAAPLDITEMLRQQIRLMRGANQTP